LRASSYYLERKRLMDRGEWALNATSAELERLRLKIEESGMSTSALAASSGVSHQTIRMIRRGISRTAWGVTVEAIQGALERGEDRREMALVPRVGTRRRLQALACDGWDCARLASLLGVKRDVVARWRGEWSGDRILASNARAVADLYEKIQGLPDPVGPSRRCATSAESHGFLPPERWDDSTIDDPDAEPLPEAQPALDEVEVQNLLLLTTAGSWKGHPRPVQRAAAGVLFRRGWKLSHIGELLGLTLSSTGNLINGRRDRPQSRANATSGS